MEEQSQEVVEEGEDDQHHKDITLRQRMERIAAAVFNFNKGHHT